jgi:hypothetical protein
MCARGVVRGGSAPQYVHRALARPAVALDVACSAPLEQLLAVTGWPTPARVGEEASRAAWLVAQHADTQLSVQRLALRLLGEAVARGEAPVQQLAMLEDRVAVTEGGLQRYGTQVADVVEGRPVPWPVLDPSRLDERRAEVGLEPWATHAARWL